MNKLVLGVLLLSIVAVTTVGITSLPNTYADTRKTIVNKCKIDEETGKCEFNQTYKSKKGDINVKNEIDASAISNGGSGGGTVDQEARDSVATLGTTVNNNNASQNAVNSEQDVQIANLTSQVNNILSMFEDAITDVDNSTGIVEPPGNDTGGGFPPTNDTGTGGNETSGNLTG